MQHLIRLSLLEIQQGQLAWVLFYFLAPCSFSSVISFPQESVAQMKHLDFQ